MKILSLGLGVQSSALYFMSSTGEIPRVDFAIFADTGGEKTATLKYLKYVEKWSKKNNGIPIVVQNKKDLLTDILNSSNSSGNRFASIPAFTRNEDGTQGMLRRQCTAEYKISQVDKAIKTLYGLKGKARYPKTEIWNGISADEMQRMTIPRQKWKTMVYPFCGYSIPPDGKAQKNGMEIMFRDQIIVWYEKNNHPLPEKSSCVFCPFQSDQGWIRLKRTAPEDFKAAIEVDNTIRNSSKKGILQPIFVHRSMKPLSEVEFDEKQNTMFGDCYGFCHV